VRHGEPEERDQGVAELALDAPAVPLDHLGRDARAEGAEAPEGFGIRVRLRARGDVEDRDRDGPPLPRKPGPRRARGSGPGAVCGRHVERGILPQNRRLEVTQGGAGFEGQLLDQQRSGIAVRLEGVRLTPRAVEPKHQ
jgi:hypothetical protein